MKPFSKLIHIYNKIFLCRRQRKNPLPQLKAIQAIHKLDFDRRYSSVDAFFTSPLQHPASLMVSSHVCHRECPSTNWACFLIGFVYPCQTLLRSYISSNPTLCLICRAGSHKYCYICH